MADNNNKKKKKKKVFTIGSATMDVFVECDDANIVSVCTKNHCSDFMSYPYGAKMDMANFSSQVGGGGVNTGMNFANLGFDTSVIFKIGHDIYSEGIMKSFENKNVNTNSVIQDKSIGSGFSIILVSFQGDRTVLAHRGANAHIKLKDINFDELKTADWFYIAPLNGESNRILEPLVTFAKENNIKVCFNAGTTSIKKGFEYMRKILTTANVVVRNKEEASMCSNITVRPDTKDESFSHEIIHPDVVKMLEKLKVNDYQVIVITDGGKGAYAFDGIHYYYCPTFKSNVVSTLGAGDAFASTFFAALDETNHDVGKSLMLASVESSSIVSAFGATEGLIPFEELQKRLSEHPEYKYTKV